MFKTDTDQQIKKLNARLNRIGKQGIPLTAAGTLDHMAFLSRKFSIKRFRRDHIIRSTWTKRGMLFEKTRRGIPIMKMEARSGNIRDYSETLEHGGTETAEKEFLAIPGMAARIGKNRRKRISENFNMRSPTMQGLRRMPSISGSPTRRFTAMLNIARKERFFGPFLITKQDAGGDRLPVGIFNLSGRGRIKRGGGQITMIRKLKKSVKVPGHPFIGPAGARIGKRMDRIYVKQAQRTLKKFGRDIR